MLPFSRTISPCIVLPLGDQISRGFVLLFQKIVCSGVGNKVLPFADLSAPEWNLGSQNFMYSGQNLHVAPIVGQLGRPCLALSKLLIAKSASSESRFKSTRAFLSKRGKLLLGYPLRLFGACLFLDWLI